MASFSSLTTRLAQTFSCNSTSLFQVISCLQKCMFAQCMQNYFLNLNNNCIRHRISMLLKISYVSSINNHLVQITSNPTFILIVACKFLSHSSYVNYRLKMHELKYSRITKFLFKNKDTFLLTETYDKDFNVTQSECLSLAFDPFKFIIFIKSKCSFKFTLHTKYIRLINQLPNKLPLV